MHLRTRFVFGLAALALGLHLSPRALYGQDRDVPQVSDETAKASHDRFEEGEGKESEFLKKRMQWFHDQRAYPHKTIPAGIRAKAAQERDRKVKLEAALRSTLKSNVTPPPEPAWSLIGPQPINAYNGFGSVDGGRVSSIAINPSNPQIMYIGGAEGGVWKSTDAGAHWTPITDSQVSLSIGAIAIDPENVNTIYVGTGEEDFSGDSYYGAGILKSTDGGTTWTQTASSFAGGQYGGAWIGAIAVHPTNSQILLAAVQNYNGGSTGVVRSADGGQTWTQVYAPNGYDIATAVTFDPTNGNIAFAALQGEGVVKSTNAGLTWTPANGSGGNVLPAASMGRIAMAMAPSSTSTLYVAANDPNSSNLLGMYKSVDGGGNWAHLTNTPDFCATQCWYDIVLAVSPTNPNFVVAGGVYTYHAGGSAVTTSSDGGTTWIDQSSTLHPDTHALAFTPDGTKLYTGNDGGMWSTTNPTASAITWTDLNNTLAIAEGYPGISMDQGNVNHTYVGTQDNGTHKYSGSLAWTNVDCGDGAATLIDYAVTSTIYTGCIQWYLDKSTNDGANWTSIDGALGGSNVSWVPPLAMDPVNHNTIYFGSDSVNQSTDGGGTWQLISSNLTLGGSLNAIAVAPTDPNTVYTGSSDGQVYVTRNALATSGWSWASINTGLPGRNVDWIAVDPTVATTAYIGYSGFTGFGDSLGHIFMTVNAGSTWTDISGDLPNTPVDAILVDPDSPQTIFIGTDIGAFYTTTGGTNWSTLGTGLPNVVVVGLGLHRASGTLRAATHGRSVWDLNISSLLPAPAVTAVNPTSVTAATAAANITVTGSLFQASASVIWNGSAVPTTFVNSGSLTAVVPVTDLTNGGTAAVAVMNGTAGKLSNSVSVTVNNPIATEASLSTSSVSAGSAAIAETITGTGFVTSSKVTWKGAALTTTYTSGTALKATIPATDLAAAGTVSVRVVNPAPGGGTSVPLTFTVNDGAPVATSLAPNVVDAGASSFLMTVTGTYFYPSSKITWKGANLPTTYVNATTLTTTVPASDVAATGTVSVRVVTPAPGGGTSVPVTFTIGDAAPVATSISPTSATAGGAAFQLTVTGSHFYPLSKVTWKGAALATTYVNSTTLHATVPTTDIAAHGTVSVRVVNPAPGGGTSVPVTFTINP